MKNRKLVSFVSLVLSVMMLLGALPLGVFAAEEGSAAEDYRGAMSEDKNGVMVYDALEAYLAKSAKDVLLPADYYVDGATAPTSTKSTLDTRYPDLTVDWALYYDNTVEGTTVVVRQGLSEIDSVSYVDAEGNLVTSESPRELTASNGGDVSYNAGYGTNDKGETTVHYKEKNVLFYMINHSASERIGTESDVSILSDYIAEGYLVVVLDFGNDVNATTPYMEMALVAARNLFTRTYTGNVVSDLKDSEGNAITVSIDYYYFLPEGCRLARDIWYFDPSIWGVNGLMDAHLAAWNRNYANTSKDVLHHGTFASVEDMIAGLKQPANGNPLDYKHVMNIVYPSQPKDGYKAPVYLQEGSLPTKENNVHNTYTRGTYTGFALNGYAAVMYDHPFHPFMLHGQYSQHESYGEFASSYDNARAAVRATRALADVFGYNADLIGAAGISKATVGVAALSVADNKDIRRGVSGYNFDVAVGDIFPEGVANTEKTPESRTMAIVQPFMLDAEGQEISSNVSVTYCSQGGGAEMLFGRGELSDKERVPMVMSDGMRDPYYCFDYYDHAEGWMSVQEERPYLLIPMLDQGHTYPVGYDDQYGYDRFTALIKFFDIYLKPEENTAPEVLWMTPTNGSKDIPVSGEWVTEWTPWAWEMNSYERTQKIQVKFLQPVTADSVNYGMVVTDGAGNRVGGTWVASEVETMYTFVTDGLVAGTTYTVTATKDITSKEGVSLKEEKSVTFTTEGTYALRPVADTYVSLSSPDAVYGSENALLIDADHMALLSYPAASVASASKIVLSSPAALDADTSVTVYALANIKVDETALSYNLLKESDAWKLKTTLGSFDVTCGQLTLDLSALSAVTELGNYVTIAIVSNEEAVTDPFVFSEDFESFVNGETYTGTDSKGEAITRVTSGGEVINGTREPDNRVYSDYIFKANGNYGVAHIVEIDGTQAFRIPASNIHTIKFYNTFKGSALTEDDIGKTFRVTFDIKTSESNSAFFGVMSANAGLGGTSSYSGDWTGPVSPYNNSFCGTKNLFITTEGEWQTVTGYITVTDTMVSTQSGLLTVQPPKYPDSRYTWFDNLLVEEATPRVTLISREGGTNDRASLVTTNSSPVEFPEGDLEGGSSWTDTSTPNVTGFTPAKDATKIGLLDTITVTFDKEMNVDTFKKGIVVKNETTGLRVGGTWKALDPTNMSFVFVTNGFMANSTYSVNVTADAKSISGFKCIPQELTVFETAEDYAVRPLVSTYVSKIVPTQHYGLDLSPIIDASRVGVLTFSATTLLGASSATLYLPVSADSAATLSISAIADYTPDDNFCYNTLKGLTLTKLTEAVVENGVAKIDVSALANLDAEKTVTLVLEFPLYSYEENFDSYVVGTKYVGTDGYTIIDETGNIKDPEIAGPSPEYSTNQGFAERIFRVAGYPKNQAYLATDAETNSQVMSFGTTGQQLIKFYNTLKDDYLTVDDIGRSFRITIDVKPDADINLHHGVSAYNATYMSGDGPSGVVEGKANTWTTITYTVTINEAMVTNQTSMFCVRASYGASGGDHTTYYDNLKVEEIVPTVKASKDTILLATVNDSISVRPTVSTYVSKFEPTKSFGLDTLPILDAMHIGVLTFPAENLLGADSAKIYLPVNADQTATVDLYAIADYTPDESFCYNALSELSLTSLGKATVEDGMAEIDVSALAMLGAEKTVTVVLEIPAYSYEVDFESLSVGGESADQSAVNKSFSSSIYRVAGNIGATVASVDGSKVLEVTGNTKPMLKFYNVVKNAYLTADDIGRTFRITVRVKSNTAMSMQYGLTNVHQSAVSEDVAPGKEVPTGTASWFWNSGSEFIDLVADTWTTITYTATITEEHVKYELGTFGFRTGTNDQVTFYVDDLRSVEVVPTVTAAASARLAIVNNYVTVDPTVSTYVSAEEPTKSFGLDTAAIVDSANIGVLGFSAKALASAPSAKLYLPVSTESAATIDIYAIADYIPGAGFCYNTLKTLSLTKSASAKVEDGMAIVDASVLVSLGATESVTIVLRSGAYTYEQNFDSYVVGTKYVGTDGYTIIDENGNIKDPEIAGPSPEYGVNKGFAERIFRTSGYPKNQAYLVTDEDTGSQVMRVGTTNNQPLKLYNTLTSDRLLTKDDIGRKFIFTFDIKTDVATTIWIAMMAAYNASSDPNDPDKIAPTASHSAFPYGVWGSGTTAANTWETISCEIEIDETMVAEEMSMISIAPRYGSSAGDHTTYYDNLKVEEIVSDITIANSARLAFEGKAALTLDEADRPVKDAEILLPRIDSAQIGVGKDITVYYYAAAETESPEMRFTVGGKSETVDGVKMGDKYVFAYKGIAPQGMGEIIKAELIEDGAVIAVNESYSVLAYCRALLGMSAAELQMSAEKHTAMKTAIADLLAYGAAAQKYTGTNTDALVDEGIEGISTFTALDESFKRIPGASTSADIRFTSAGVYFDYTNHLYFKFNAAGITEENFVLRMTNQATGKSTAYTLSDFDVLGTDQYRIMTSGIAALDFGTMYTVTLNTVDGAAETVVQTLEYGINAYVYSMQNDADMAELAQRTYLYGISAKAYADAE